MIYFLTSNKGKFLEVSEFMSKKGTKIGHLNYKIEEPRGTIEEIASSVVKEAYKIFKKPIFVDDTGLFINSLNGFPGEFSSWVYNKIGLEGILKILENKEDRTAYFKTVIAFYDGNNLELFEGRVDGIIANEIRGDSIEGLGYDSIFIPSPYKETFAENNKLKKIISHRVRALEKFSAFLSHYDK